MAPYWPPPPGLQSLGLYPVGNGSLCRRLATHAALPAFLGLAADRTTAPEKYSFPGAQILPSPPGEGFPPPLSKLVTRFRNRCPEGTRLFDAIVVGAGPVGCHVATGLAKQGYAVLVVEEHPQVGLPARCTGLIGEQAFAKFALPEEAVQRPVHSLAVYGPHGACLRFGGANLLARVVDRPRLDAILADRAKAAGAQFLLGRRVVDATVEAQRVVVVLEGEDEGLSARSLVIATGARTNLPEKLGLGRLPGYLFGAQMEIALAGVEEVEVYLGRELSPGSFAWVVPTTAGRARVGLTAYNYPRERLQLFLADGRLKGRLGGPLPEPTVAPIPLGTLRTTLRERVVVVGEAAGQVKTTTGGGVYFGLLAAEAAVEVLGEGLAGDKLSADFLKAYELKWRELLGREIEYGLRLRRLAAKLDDAALAFFLNLANQDGLKGLVRRLAHFDWHASLIAALLDGPLHRTREAPAAP